MSGNSMDLKVALSVGGNAEVKRALSDLGRAVKDTGRKIEESGHSGASAKEALEPLGELMRHIGSLAGGAAGEIGELASALGKLGGGLGGIVAAIGGAATAFAGLALHGAEAAASVKEAATRIGTTAENYTGLSFAFRQSGASAEAFERAMARISVAQGKAADATHNYAAETRLAKHEEDAARQSAKQLADERERIAQGLSESLRSNRIELGEQLRKIDQQQHTEELSLRLSYARQQRAMADQVNDAEIKGAAASAGELAKLNRRKLEDDNDFELNLQRLRQRGADEVAEAQRASNLRVAAESRRAQLEEDRALKAFYDRQVEAARKHADELEKLRAASEDKFAKLGVELLKNGTARDPTEVFRDVADKIAQIDNVAERSATAVDLFGRRIGTQLVEALAKGRDGLEKLIEETTKLGLVYSGEQQKIGKEFMESLDKLKSVISATFGKIGLEFAPMFTRLMNQVAEFIGRNQDNFVAFAHAIATSMKFAGESLSEVAGVLNGVLPQGLQLSGAGLGALLVGIRLLPAALNLASFALRGLMLAGGPITLTLKLLAIAIAALLPVVIENLPQITAYFEATAKSIKAAWDDAGTFLQSKFTEAASAIESAINTLSDWFTGAWDKIKAGFAAVGDFISQEVTNILGFLQSIIDKAKDVASAVATALGGSGSSSATVQGHATGGQVHGPGGIDQVPARLTAGEYVINKAAVDHYGTGMMDALNTRHFALGGFVDALGSMATAPMRFAAGGSVPAAAGGTPVHLHMPGGQSFALAADEHVAGALVRYAAGRQMTSGGTKPSWYAGR